LLISVAFSLMLRCVSLDDSDAEACYAQSVYLDAAVLEPALCVVSGAACGWRQCSLHGLGASSEFQTRQDCGCLIGTCFCRSGAASRLWVVSGVFLAWRGCFITVLMAAGLRLFDLKLLLPQRCGQ